MDGRRIGPGRPRILLTVPAAALVALAGCGSASEAGGTSPAAASSIETAAGEYSTAQFAVPMTVSVGTELDGPSPALDSDHLLYWDGTAGGTKIRFLLPAVTYAPGTGQPMSPPADFLGYLHAQEQHGLELSEETTRTVGGRPATLLTATSQAAPEGSYDGSLGCVTAETSLDDADGCFGVQPDLELRLAVVDLGGRTLLAWARTSAGDPGAAAFYADFEQMLDSIRLR
jgi:hypothetical protein